MSIVNSDKIKGEISLETILKLYSDLIYYEENLPSFIRARNNDFPKLYDEAMENIVTELIPELIKDLRNYGLDSFKEISTRINNLEKYLSLQKYY